jgi:hypothetical protein
MEGNTGILIAIAGFGLVCAGTLFILLLIILRVTGRSAWTFFSLLIRRGAEEDPSDTPTVAPRVSRNLSEVAAQIVERDAPPATLTAHSPTPTTPRLDASQQALDRSLPPRRRQDYDQDEVFGGLLDNDGDGSPDY